MGGRDLLTFYDIPKEIIHLNVSLIIFNLIINGPAEVRENLFSYSEIEIFDDFSTKFPNFQKILRERV